MTLKYRVVHEPVFLEHSYVTDLLEPLQLQCWIRAHLLRWGPDPNPPMWMLAWFLEFPDLIVNELLQGVETGFFSMNRMHG